MKIASVSETKNQLSALLDRVKRGETVLITDRSRPVAQLSPIPAGTEAPSDEARLAALERAGVVRRAPDLAFVCFDKRLAAAAEREGFAVEGSR